VSVVDLLEDLVRIDSSNPGLADDGAGESEVAAFVADWARQAGLTVGTVEPTPGRPSVIVRGGRATGGRTLLLCGHLDTVGLAGVTDPLVPRVDGDRLYARGGYDMKAGLAAALVACGDAAAAGITGEVVVAAVADEEHASLGVQEVLGAMQADAAIVTEPTELELIVAHKGFVWAEIEVHGRAAHGSRPLEGVDAIVKTGPILTALGELDAALCARTHPLLGRGSVHASVIAGGSEMSSYPGRCVLGLERRTLPGETAADIEAEVEGLIAGPDLQATQRTLLVREPFEVPRDAAIVHSVRAAAAQVLGAPPALAGAPYWADAAFIAAAGIPTVMFGTSGAGAHAVEEWVSVEDSVAVTRVLVAAAQRVCV
jgi:acetylornithine deacetylase